mmetsp:Transcript_30669/g.80131  ORF Transcript_30669/g.80131 Transcript_30669/m.80131 type:complete len:101 (+) Transcript_30669:2692-2994(+)
MIAERKNAKPRRSTRQHCIPQIVVGKGSEECKLSSSLFFFDFGFRCCLQQRLQKCAGDSAREMLLLLGVLTVCTCRIYAPLFLAPVFCTLACSCELNVDR